MPASWKVVVAMVFTSPKPPLTLAGLPIQFLRMVRASMICESLNLIWWLTHLS